jgi:hypothetical protein
MPALLTAGQRFVLCDYGIVAPLTLLVKYHGQFWPLIFPSTSVG